jgi:D-lactate dehydrogenase
MKILFFSIHEYDKPAIILANSNVHHFEMIEDELNTNTAHLAQGYDAVSLFTSDQAPADVLKILHKCGVKFIALRSVGYEHVDLKKAKELGIKVANVPAYSPYSVAEHAVTILQALNRKLHIATQLQQVNDFSLNNLVGFDLFGKTVGIVGTGKIGEAFARIMHGFGCKLLANDIEKNQKLIEATGIKYTSVNDLCEQSDVIALFCPLNDATRYLLNKDTFKIMKKGVFIVNTARGGIVNTIDLMNAIDNGTVAGAALDVYEYEKPIFFKNHNSKRINDDLFAKLRSYPNVLITGHQAFLTKEALKGIAETTLFNLNAWESKSESLNDLN